MFALLTLESIVKNCGEYHYTKHPVGEKVTNCTLINSVIPQRKKDGIEEIMVQLG